MEMTERWQCDIRGALKVQLMAPPVDDRANDSLRRLPASV
jgi:uncharacterized protein YggU (UPF0235/DUF167 family)